MVDEKIEIDEEVEDERQSNRIRQYPEGHKGPYVVNIRAVNKPLESKKIQKYVFDTYKHVKEIIHLNEHKIKVVFEERAEKKIASENGASSSQSNSLLTLKGDKIISGIKSALDEANDLPKSPVWNKKFRVYIAAKHVEVQGVISWPKNEEITDFVQLGEGKFSNPQIKSVKVIEATRLKKKTGEASNETLEDTGVVILTFEGVLLPNKVNVEGLLIPVRQFRNKQMYCARCKRYNHTEKMCNNKKVEEPTDDTCMHCKSNEHVTGDMKCPKRKFLEKKSMLTEKKIRKKTIAEVLKELDPEATMQNESNVEAFPLLPGMSRKRAAEKRNADKEKYSDVLKSPERKKKPPNENEGLPPGFVNPNRVENAEMDSVAEFIKSIIDGMDFPPFIKNLIIKFVTPFIQKLVEKFTNTVMQNLNGSSQCQ